MTPKKKKKAEPGRDAIAIIGEPFPAGNTMAAVCEVPGHPSRIVEVKLRPDIDGQIVATDPNRRTRCFHGRPLRPNRLFSTTEPGALCRLCEYELGALDLPRP